MNNEACDPEDWMWCQLPPEKTQFGEANDL